MNLNTVVVSGTVVRLGDVKKEPSGKTVVFYLELSNRTKNLVQDGEVADAHLTPVRVKYYLPDNSDGVFFKVGSYVVVEGELYSYKISYEGRLVYSSGVRTRRCGMGVPLTREVRGKVIQEYKKGE